MRGQCHGQFIAFDHRDLDRRGIHQRQAHQPEVKPPRGDRGNDLDTVHFLQRQFDQRIGGAVGADDAGQQLSNRRTDEADAQPPAQARCALPHRIAKAFRRRQRRARRRQRRHARRSQAHTTRFAHEQRRAQILFQLADRNGQRRLRNMQPLCRAMEIERFGKHRKIAQLAQVHAVPFDSQSIYREVNSILADCVRFS